MQLNPRGSDQITKEPRTWSEDSPCLHSSRARSDNLVPPRSISMCRPAERRRRVVHDRPGRAEARAGGHAIPTASTPAGLPNHTAAHRVLWSKDRPCLRRGEDITGNKRNVNPTVQAHVHRPAHEHLYSTFAAESHLLRPSCRVLAV